MILLVLVLFLIGLPMAFASIWLAFKIEKRFFKDPPEPTPYELGYRAGLQDARGGRNSDYFDDYVYEIAEEYEQGFF